MQPKISLALNKLFVHEHGILYAISTAVELFICSRLRFYGAVGTVPAAGSPAGQAMPLPLYKPKKLTR